MNITKYLVNAVLIVASCVFSGCAAFKCDNYMTYDQTLDSWLGSELSAYESRNDIRALNVMERPRDQLEYEYDTPYYNLDGSTTYCRTFLEVDKSSGDIRNWRTAGNCYMHGRCQQ